MFSDCQCMASADAEATTSGCGDVLEGGVIDDGMERVTADDAEGIAESGDGIAGVNVGVAPTMPAAKAKTAPKRKDSGAAGPPTKAAKPTVCGLCGDECYEDSIVNYGSELRPCYRHVSCNQGYNLLKMSYQSNVEDGDQHWQVLTKDDDQLKKPVIGVRPPPGSDLRTKAGKQERVESEKKCKKFTDAVEVSTSVASEAEVLFLSKREYIQHWKLRVGATDEEAIQKWQEDCDNTDIERAGEGDEDDGTFILAVAQPLKKTGITMVKHSQALQNKTVVRTAEDAAAVQRRMSSQKQVTDRLFARVGNDCLRHGAASSVVSGGSGSREPFMDLDLGFDTRETPMKRPRVETTRVPKHSPAKRVLSAAGDAPSPSVAQTVGELEDASSAACSDQGTFTQFTPTQPFNQGVAFSKARFDIVAKAKEVTATLAHPKSAIKTCARLVETLGREREEVIDLEAPEMLDQIELLAKELARVQAQRKSWKKESYQESVQKVIEQVRGAESLLDKITEVADQLETIAKTEKQDKITNKRKERRKAKQALGKVIAKLKGNGFSEILATRLAPIFDSMSRLERGETIDFDMNENVGRDSSGAFFGEHAMQPKLWTKAFLDNMQLQSVDCFGVVMSYIVGALVHTGLLQSKQAVLQGHMAKSKVKGNHLCLEFTDALTELDYMGIEADALGTAAAASPWILCLAPHSCMFGPSSFPLFGVGSLFAIASGAVVVYMQDIGTIPGSVNMYMEYLSKQDASDKTLLDVTIFAATEGDVFWLPYGYGMCIVGVAASYTVVQQPWFSKELAAGTRTAAWVQAKAWQPDYMYKRRSQLPWTRIGDAIGKWME